MKSNKRSTTTVEWQWRRRLFQFVALATCLLLATTTTATATAAKNNNRLITSTSTETLPPPSSAALASSLLLFKQDNADNEKFQLKFQWNNNLPSNNKNILHLRQRRLEDGSGSWWPPYQDEATEAPPAEENPDDRQGEDADAPTATEDATIDDTGDAAIEDAAVDGEEAATEDGEAGTTDGEETPATDEETPATDEEEETPATDGEETPPAEEEETPPPAPAPTPSAPNPDDLIAYGPIVTKYIYLILYGIDTLPDPQQWASITTSYMTNFFLEYGSRVYDAEATITFVKQLGTGGQVEILYYQTTSYKMEGGGNSQSGGISADEMVAGPFYVEANRQKYVQLLKEQGGAGYAMVNGCSIAEPLGELDLNAASASGGGGGGGDGGDAAVKEESNSTIYYIAGGAGGLVLLLCLCCCCCVCAYMMYRQMNKKDLGELDSSDEEDSDDEEYY